MNWKTVVAVGVLLIGIIAFAIYFKGVGVLAIPWQLIKENATTIAAVGAIIAALIAFVVYIENKKANAYRYLADLYYEILRIGLKYPDFLNPEKTQKYKEAWPSYLHDHDMYIRYDAYARMCWAHAEDIYDVKFLQFFFKRDFRRLYACTFERYKSLHGVWFQDNITSFLLHGFVDFVKLNKWRDYLDEREADRLRWCNVVEDYDEKILNPLLPGVNNPLFTYLEKDLNEVKYKVVADFGCGNGKLVEILAKEEKFEKVYGIDYSDNLLKMAKKRCKNLQNVTCSKIDMTKLEEEREKLGEEIYGKIDIAFSINSILPRNPKDTPIILHEIYKAVKPGGLFIAILPSFDTVLYLKDLWYERRIKHLKERYNHGIKKVGSKLKARWDTYREFKRRKLNERKDLYADDFSNVQRFIHESEIELLLNKAGFELKQTKKVTYPWNLCKKYNYDYFPGKEEIWDWFVVAEKPGKEN